MQNPNQNPIYDLFRRFTDRSFLLTLGMLYMIKYGIEQGWEANELAVLLGAIIPFVLSEKAKDAMAAKANNPSPPADSSQRNTSNTFNSGSTSPASETTLGDVHANTPDDTLLEGADADNAG